MKLNYTCPKCKRKFEAEVDQDSDIVDLECSYPDCGYKFKGRVKKTALDNSGKDPLPADKAYKVGENPDIECPHCGKTTHVDGPQKKGVKTVGCQHCKGPIEVEFIDPTIVVPVVKYPYRGKIQLVQRLFIKKDFPLRVGTNIIGRADKDSPSDIQLNDAYASRRSVEIEVKVGERGGFFFVFKLRNATNPVLINNLRIEPGSEILLNYGDIITMGRTKLRFDKIV